MMRKLGLWWLCFSFCTTLHALPIGAESSEAQLRVRAQFVYNFANFVEWPKDAFSDPRAPIKVCLFGEVDFAPYLYAFAETLIGSRTLKIQRTNEIDEIRAGCHILYVGQDERVKLPTFWQQIHYIYVLSIGDRQGFADKGGIINILREQDKMQFEVNIENALANGLFLDSDLLALARVIKRNTAINSAEPSTNNAPAPVDKPQVKTPAENTKTTNDNSTNDSTEKKTPENKSAPSGAVNRGAIYGSHKE